MNRPLQPTRRRLLTMAGGTALFPIAAPLSSSIAFAQSDTQSDPSLARKINLAGRQRMLSQRMSRAVFFLALDIEPTMHLRMLGTAHRVFDETLIGLREGSVELGMTQERHEKVLTRLTAVQGYWQSFGASVSEIHSRGSVLDEELQVLAQVNLELLRTSNDVVKALVAKTVDRSGSLGMNIAIDVAGRQRMLSQKSSKEVAMIALGLGAQETQEALGKTLRLFEKSLNALMEGLPSVAVPPPPVHIHAKLVEVASIWERFSRAAQFVADAGIASPFELAAITAQADPLLTTMNDAVFLYEAWANE